jgi:hypothetical protein
MQLELQAYEVDAGRWVSHLTYSGGTHTVTVALRDAKERREMYPGARYRVIMVIDE